MADRPSILIVDSQSSITAVLERCLERDAHQLQTVNNTADAVLALESRDFDLVLVDPSLPSLPGVDLVQTLRARNECAAVIVMTTAPSVVKKLESHGLDVAAVLEKPFTLKELRGAIAPFIANAAS
jgi:DNA-binding response OmpR family regulator